MRFWESTTLDLLLGGNFLRHPIANRMQMRRLQQMRLFQPVLSAPLRWRRSSRRLS